ncbi:transcriptional regulator, partial [Bacteroides fragilis]
FAIAKVLNVDMKDLLVSAKKT